MPMIAPTDGPPPSPALDPAAAQEAGRPASAVQTLTAGQRPSAAMGGNMPGAMQGGGPDLSGIMVLGQKIDEALLALAQAAPVIGPDVQQMQAILMNALGKFAAQASSAGPGQPQPTGLTVSRSGPQFPGAQDGGKSF